MEKVTLQKVQKSEGKELQEIGIRTFLESFGAMNNEADMKAYLDEKFSLAYISEELNTPESQFFFLKEGETLIGYLKVNTLEAQDSYFKDKNLEIQRIYLLGEKQGKGYGHLLIEKALTIAKEQEVKSIWLGVWEKNFGAIRFYERYGFKTFDKHSFFLGEDEQTDFLMKLEL